MCSSLHCYECEEKREIKVFSVASLTVENLKITESVLDAESTST